MSSLRGIGLQKKNKNPFGKPARQSFPGKSTEILALANDENSLIQRATERRSFDFESVPLDVLNQTKSNVFARSFQPLSTQYPHHTFLIKQLLQGAHLDIGRRLVAYQTHQECYYGITEFIESLNHIGLQQSKHLSCIADINFQTTSNFKAFLLQRFPNRTANRKRYGRVKSVVSKLQAKYAAESSVGIAIAWAQAPRMNETPSETYSNAVFNRLVEASFTEIKSIMKMMESYKQAQANSCLETENVRYAVTKSRVFAGYSMTETVEIVSALTRRYFPAWPFYMDFAAANHLFTREWELELPTGDYQNRVLCRAMRGISIVRTLKNQSTGDFFDDQLHVGQMAYISQSFFTFRTIYPFILFIQINTGWNLEVIMSLSDNLNDHIGEDLIDPDQYVLIYGAKWRTEDVVRCRSNKRDPYSVYSLLRFIENVLSPFKQSPHYVKGYLLQAVSTKNLWKRNKRIISEMNSPSIAEESSRFLKRHGIQISSEAAKPSVEARRIRTTWETKRREQGLPLETVSPMMGHSDFATTLVHYDSDPGSSELRNKKLRHLQTQWTSDFSNYGVKLATDESLKDLRQAILNGKKAKSNIKCFGGTEIRDEEKIVHMLSAAGQTYIVACLDAMQPTWPSSGSFVERGSKCTYFNRCCMCEQAVIFKESLPYVARRISDLEGLKSRITAPEWAANYADEIEAWESILTRWNPPSDVFDAVANSKLPQYSLPLTMRGA